MNTMKRFVTIAVCASLVGCATIGETPRSKIYDRVDPISIKDMSRYGLDVAECDKLATEHARKRAGQEVGAMIVGALLGAALGAAITPGGYGIRGDVAAYGAGVGAASGLGASGNRTLNEQDRLIYNCMTNRGYKVLY